MGKGTWVHWVILLLHLVAVLIFTRGFLLTRTELPNFSQCHDVSQSPCFFDNQHHNQTDGRCWSKPAIDRLVIIVFDALRFDFVAPSTFFQEKKPWMNKLKLVQDLAATNASSARIFKAIADPPTTSLQRLKGLTTGGLPTFIDVGNSFGAPAIVEDNLLLQLAQNGKRVVMMGDDTWTQLFPSHFLKAFPYPSFNVRDLDTVDNGCIEHLLPFLHQDDWDVLIAHFLGVDHAGHIFGVDSPQMIGKLEQYNTVLQNVVEALESQSEPGERHENTLLLVMGDHGQTVNGDHGGGTAEEVETSMFAMSFKNPPSSIPAEFDTSSCGLDLDKRNICISSIQQLDFAATVSALLGIPFPFGSIGRVNPQLYALGGGTWNFEDSMGSCQSQPKLDEWMLNYVNVLCTNSWQVKRYIDIYSASSVIGFSHEDLLHIGNIYAKAEERWSHTTRKLLQKKESCNELLPALKRQIEEYSTFLASVAELARSKWTEFNLKLMGTGLGIMFISLIAHFLAIKKVKEQYGFSFTSSGDSGISFGLIFACFVGVIRACSFLSNSFILEEGKVACFLLATTGFVKLRSSFIKKKMISEAFVLLLLVTVCRFSIQFGLTKQAPSSEFVGAYPSWMIGITSLWNFVAEVLPVLALALLALLLHKAITRSSPEGIWNYIIIGTGLSYILIAVYWTSESSLLNLAWVLKDVGRNFIPRLVYAIGAGQLLLLAINQLFIKRKSSVGCRILSTKAVAMFSVWSSTIIILLGKQGPFIALAFIIGGYCIMRLDNVELDGKDGGSWNLMLDPVPVTQWSLFSVCLFFCTGHWCAFDGLRYGAAFTGFDEFVLVPQAILLTMDTYGFSLILPIIGLPFLVACRGQTEKGKQPILGRLSLVYMIYGLIMATSVTATIVCVTIHRRHLMGLDSEIGNGSNKELVYESMKKQEKQGGFKANYFIFAMMFLDNIGFVANMASLVVYFMFVIHFDISGSATTTTNYLGSAFLLTIVGGFISDAYMNRLNTTLLFGVTELLGYMLLIIQSHYKKLQPLPCGESTCVHGTKALLFYASLSLIALGGGGIRGAIPALGADQFNYKKPEERRHIASFFNWLLLSITLGAVVGVTFVVYVSTVVGWDIGFIISLSCAAAGLFIVALGKPYYRVRVPGESPLLRVLQVLVASVKNWKVDVPQSPDELYESTKKRERLHHTDQFRLLDKAAINPKGVDAATASKWKVCTVTQVEEVKILTRMMPILLSTILMNTCLAQLQTLSVQQGILMDTLVGSFDVPAATIPVIPLLFMSVLIPIYEFTFVPLLRKFTGHPNGISHLQRVGVGLVLSAISMTIAGFVEVKRKHEIIHHNHKISLFWLAYHYAIFGIADMFTLVGLMEFFYREAPAGMRSLSTSFSWLSLSIGYYLSSVFVELINSITGKFTDSKLGWLEGRDMNKNHVDYFYWFLAILSVLNFANYLFWANWYTYKNDVTADDEMLIKADQVRAAESQSASVSFVSKN